MSRHECCEALPVRMGAHLPLADLGVGLPTVAELFTYVHAASELGFITVAANDHVAWQRPWLDGPTALACVAAASEMTLATSVILPVLRHPVLVAKSLTTLATVAEGPVVGGLCPGSSSLDFAAVGVPFEERWGRFDEALRLVRTLVHDTPAEAGRLYPAEPALTPVTDPPPGLWFASWESDRRLAAMASFTDGWMASAYNATPVQYQESRARLDGHLRVAGRDPEASPDAIVTTWLQVTDRRHEAEHRIEDLLAPLLNRDPATLRHLPIGSSEHCAGALEAYAAAGGREVFVWPVRDRLQQLERCVAPMSSL